MLSNVKIVVNNPYTAQASIQEITSSKDFNPLQDISGGPIYGIEPTVSFDGQLIIYQNWEANGNNGSLFYVTRSDGQVSARGWSRPKSISQMYLDPALKTRYPFAKYGLRNSSGSILSGNVLGAYPWMSLDGSDLFWSYTNHDDGARRAGSVVAGSSTKGLIRLIDGGPNNSRRGCYPANNSKYGESRSCSSSNIQSRRLFMSSIGRTPGMWSPFEFLDYKALPISDKLFTYPLYDSDSGRYTEVSLEETIVGNYDLYIEMSEGVTSNGDYDKTLTPDVSGKYFVPRLNSGAHFAEETFSDCNDRICPQNDFQNPKVPLFSGKALYFDTNGALNVNPTSATGVGLLLSFAY